VTFSHHAQRTPQFGRNPALCNIDDDTVSLSNLQRQVIHATPDIGRPKADSAAEFIARINPHVALIQHGVRLDASNAQTLFSPYDIVVDGSDNFKTRYLAADRAEHMQITLVTGAVGRFDGSLTVLQPWKMTSGGRQNPSYRDLFPAPPPPGVVPSCAEAGIVGALTGVIGTLQAMEVIKLVTGAGEPLIGRLLMYDALTARFETIKYGRKVR
jgi:molybdopterin/thiamine biosynthesis adenylyltransferase